MEIAITKMSANGQVVIPMEVRKDANIKPSTKFLVFNEDGNIMLKQLNKKQLKEEMELIARIEQSEEQIKKGKFVKGNTDMTPAELVDLLTKS